MRVSAYSDAVSQSVSSNHRLGFGYSSTPQRTWASSWENWNAKRAQSSPSTASWTRISPAGPRWKSVIGVFVEWETSITGRRSPGKRGSSVPAVERSTASMSEVDAFPHPSSEIRSSSVGGCGSCAVPDCARTARIPIAPQVLAAAFMVHPYYTGNDPFSVETSRRRGVQRAHARTARRRPAPEESRPDPAARSHDGAPQDRARGLAPLRPRGPGATLVPVDPPRDGAPAARAGRSAPHHLAGGRV